MKHYFHIVSFLLLVVTLSAQTPDCRQLLKNYYAKVNVSTSPKPGQCYYMHTVNESHMRDSSISPVSKSQVKLLMTDKLYYYLSDLMDVYKDEQDLFVVSKADKSVYWLNPTNQAQSGMPGADGKLFQIRDSLLMASEIISCKDFTENNISYKKLELVVPSALRAQSKLQSFSCIFDMRDSMMTQINMRYIPSHKIKQSIVYYKAIDFNYSKAPAEKNVKDIFISSNGKLNPKYKGYELVDNREKGSKGKSKKNTKNN